MSAPSCILPDDAEAKALGEIDRAVRAGAARALRTRADLQRLRAAEGSSSAGEKYPDVVVRSPEAAMAANLADAFERIAIEIEAGAPI
jgi:hypothetical protein